MYSLEYNYTYGKGSSFLTLMLCHLVAHPQTQATREWYYYPTKCTEPLTEHSITQEDLNPQQHCCEYIKPHILTLFMCFLAATIFTVSVTLLCGRTQYASLVHCNLAHQQGWQVATDQLLDWVQSSCQTQAPWSTHNEHNYYSPFCQKFPQFYSYLMLNN